MSQSRGKGRSPVGARTQVHASQPGILIKSERRILHEEKLVAMIGLMTDDQLEHVLRAAEEVAT